MLGLIFTTLAEMVESNHGIGLWNKVLKEADVPNLGAFTLGASYSDGQLIRILDVLENHLELPQAELLKQFGEYLFPHLINSYPEITEKFTNCRDLLLHLDNQIHQELSFYHPHEAKFPYFHSVSDGQDKIYMHYKSSRKLCFLAEGLIKGAGRHFHQTLVVEQKQCCHLGAPECVFEIILT